MNEKPVDGQRFSKQQKQALIDRLRERGVPNACPMCSSKQWTLADGYVKHLVQTEIEENRFGAVRMSDVFLPLIALVCNHCGFTSQHSAGMLGLLEPQEQTAQGNGSGE